MYILFNLSTQGNRVQVFIYFGKKLDYELIVVSFAIQVLRGFCNYSQKVLYILLI